MFLKKLVNNIKNKNSHLCLGLDPRQDLILGNVFDFLRKVVDETVDEVVCYKPNIAYFEALGPKGYEILYSIIRYIPDDIPVLLDAKRSDIAETQKYYAQAYFRKLNLDAVTVNPYLGLDSIEPYLIENKGIYLLGVTSNKGALDIQHKIADSKRIYQIVFDFAEKLHTKTTSVGLVVGLTNISNEIFNILPDVPLLIPGLGAQGGEVNKLTNLFSTFKSPIIINVSRGILFKDSHLTFKEKAKYFNKIINQVKK